jgi:hypothetical protein
MHGNYGKIIQNTKILDQQILGKDGHQRKTSQTTLNHQILNNLLPHHLEQLLVATIGQQVTDRQLPNKKINPAALQWINQQEFLHGK